MLPSRERAKTLTLLNVWTIISLIFGHWDYCDLSTVHMLSRHGRTRIYTFNHIKWVLTERLTALNVSRPHFEVPSRYDSTGRLRFSSISIGEMHGILFGTSKSRNFETCNLSAQAFFIKTFSVLNWYICPSQRKYKLNIMIDWCRPSRRSTICIENFRRVPKNARHLVWHLRKQNFETAQANFLYASFWDKVKPQAKSQITWLTRAGLVKEALWATHVQISLLISQVWTLFSFLALHAKSRYWLRAKARYLLTQARRFVRGLSETYITLENFCWSIKAK